MHTQPDQSYPQFHTVFNTYYESLCNYAFSFVKNTHTSEDIVQEIFIRIWQDRRDLIQTDAVRWYLFTSVRNNSISYLRKKKNTGTVEWNDQDVWQEPAMPKDAGSHMDYEGLLQKAIGLLPPKCREVFVLSRFSNMTYKQIAATLDISVKTVENQLGKALKIMRFFLKEQGIYLVYLLAGLFS